MTMAYAEVIGDPIRQSKSPAIHGFWLAGLGIAAEYRATHVMPAALGDFVAARRGDPAWRGCNVTMPHKQAVIPLLDRLDPLAARIGAVNTIVPENGALVGYNTDAPGFLEPLRDWLDARAAPPLALVLGSGGAARAVITALADEGATVVLAARDRARACALLDELAPGGFHRAVDLAPLLDPDSAIPPGDGGPDLVVNATSLGMVGHDPLTFDWRRAAPDALAYDIVTSPLDTAFLVGARARGAGAIDGLAMLIGQADHAFRRFFGALPQRGAADLALRARLDERQAAA